MLTRRFPSYLNTRSFPGGMDQVIEDLWRSISSPSIFSQSPAGYPALNVWESGDGLHVEAELPGMRMQDLDLEVKGRQLTVAGEYEQSDDEKTRYHVRERGVGNFKRVLHLPVDVDAERIEAKLENGVLTVDLPKAETARARKIEVRRVGA